jgi:hypothetical protein
LVIYILLRYYCNTVIWSYPSPLTFLFLSGTQGVPAILIAAVSQGLGEESREIAKDLSSSAGLTAPAEKTAENFCLICEGYHNCWSLRLSNIKVILQLTKLRLRTKIYETSF